jgi:hypothetical protein
MKNYDLLIIILAIIVLFALMVLTADAGAQDTYWPIVREGRTLGHVLRTPPLVVATFVSPSPSPTIGATETRWPFDG